MGTAERITSYLYDNLRDANGGRECVLVRCFQISAYAQLPLDYQYAADRLLALMPSQPDMRCLALLATRGVKTTWNDVATSLEHQAIPLPSVEVVRRAPMIARLLEDFGLSAEQVVKAPESSDFLLESSTKSFNVFHIPEARGSAFIPAQEAFVLPYGVRSVLGMGGLLPNGELFALLLFSVVHISRETAELFQELAGFVRDALAVHDASRVFPMGDSV